MQASLGIVEVICGEIGINGACEHCFSKLFGESCGSGCEVAHVALYPDMFGACGGVVEEVVGEFAFELGLQVGVIDHHAARQRLLEIGAVEGDITEGIVVEIELWDGAAHLDVGCGLLPAAFYIELCGE